MLIFRCFGRQREIDSYLHPSSAHRSHGLGHIQGQEPRTPRRMCGEPLVNLGVHMESAHGLLLMQKLGESHCGGDLLLAVN